MCNRMFSAELVQGLRSCPTEGLAWLNLMGGRYTKPRMSFLLVEDNPESMTGRGTKPGLNSDVFLRLAEGAWMAPSYGGVDVVAAGQAVTTCRC